jgi:hypothetical protein
VVERTLDFDGRGHELLNLLGRAAGPLRDDGDFGVRHVRKRLDGRVSVAHHPGNNRHQREQENKAPILEGEGNNALNELIHLEVEDDFYNLVITCQAAHSAAWHKAS